ncbi:MAG: class I SAM-dependent methyltransferase, partial [Actinomycetota bacterium]|nr:class I SAM-dependent methyltransferase [Actinomycetota bacterium]
LMSYETRGLYGERDPEPERFSRDTWVERDICDKKPWPFSDGQFDFAICSHTLEDVRDPIWVCSELNRVARAGYIEVPARAEEQTKGVHGAWVGWSHHRWLVDIDGDHVGFVLKPHLLHGRSEFWVSLEWTRGLAASDLVSRLFWEGSFGYSEKIFFEPEELHAYLRAEVERNAGVTAVEQGGNGSFLKRARRVLKRPG